MNSWSGEKPELKMHGPELQALPPKPNSNSYQPLGGPMRWSFDSVVKQVVR